MKSAAQITYYISYRFLSWCKLPKLIFSYSAKYMLCFYILTQIILNVLIDT